MPYPVGTSTILPGNQSFVVVAAAGAMTGAYRIDVMNGAFGEIAARASDYGASDSSWIRKIANKYAAMYTCTVAEDVTTLESLLTLGSRMDVYVKRSSLALTYDKLADALFESQPKTMPEDGSNHRTYELTFSGGTYSTGVASGSVPTLAP